MPASWRVESWGRLEAFEIKVSSGLRQQAVCALVVVIGKRSTRAAEAPAWPGHKQPSALVPEFSQE